MTGSAPEDYLVSGAADIDLLSCAAHFDGSGAGSDFLPAIQILDEAGQVAATVVGSKVTAGDSADVTFAPFLESPPVAAAGGGALPWCEAFTAGYSPSDYYFGRSPFQINYRSFDTTDATAFAFDQTDNPTVGDGEVHILRDGLYRVQLMIPPSGLTSNAKPGYNWDIAVQVIVQGSNGSQFFGAGPAPGSTFYPSSAWSFMIQPRNTWFPTNGISLQGAGQAVCAIGEATINLAGASVHYPVQVYCRFNHGLNDGDVLAPIYYLNVMRVGDGNPAGFVG